MRDSALSDSRFGYEQLHLETSGPSAGEPVLLLHGWGSSARNMQAVAEALSASHRVYNLDLPGHGHSPAPPEPMGVPEHAALVARLLEEQVGGPATLLGHSNGGRISLYMAGDDAMRHLVQRLILISPSGVRPARSMKVRLRSATARALKAPFAILPEPAREFGLDWLRHSLVWRALGSSDYRSLHGVMRETFVRTVNHYVEDRLPSITAPTLIFWGDRDEAVSRRQISVLEENIPDSGVVILEGAGHYAYLDSFGMFIEATRYFLGDEGLGDGGLKKEN
jgi:pimeloyl-ACP methyl ester carboxylesterase